LSQRKGLARNIPETSLSFRTGKEGGAMVVGKKKNNITPPEEEISRKRRRVP